MAFNRSFGNRNFGGNRGGFRRSFGPREMTKIKCSECGQEGEVPFKPKEGLPVYCKDCFMKRKGITPRAKREESEESEESEGSEESEEVEEKSEESE